MKLGANSVLFGGHGIEAAFKYLAMAGYYVGAALMFFGAWMLWRRRPA